MLLATFSLCGKPHIEIKVSSLSFFFGIFRNSSIKFSNIPFFTPQEGAPVRAVT